MQTQFQLRAFLKFFLFALALPAGDTDGLAWNVVLSLMEFKTDHSISVNYGQVGAGWLLSPKFPNNETPVEIRYV